MEKHHRVFAGQGGLDFELNYIYLTSEQHRGDKGPHKCKEIDLRYKRELQQALEGLLTKEYYSLEELVELLNLKQAQAHKAFRNILKADGIGREDAIKRIMGGRFYL